MLDNLRTLAGNPFVSMQKPPEKPPLWPPFAPIGMGLVSTLLGVLVARRSYAIAHGQSQTGQPEHKPATQAVTLCARLAPAYASSPHLHAQRRSIHLRWHAGDLGARDRWMIALSGWGFAVAVDRSNLDLLSEVLPYARVVLFGIGAWIGTLPTSAAAARLVFPLVSSRGNHLLVRATDQRRAGCRARQARHRPYPRFRSAAPSPGWSAARPAYAAAGPHGCHASRWQRHRHLLPRRRPRRSHARLPLRERQPPRPRTWRDLVHRAVDDPRHDLDRVLLELRLH